MNSARVGKFFGINTQWSLTYRKRQSLTRKRQSLRLLTRKGRMLGYNSVYGCIIRESCSHLPKELCYLIGSFLRMSNKDRIRCMLANRDSPDVFVCVTSVVNELDEIFELRYSDNDPDDLTKLDPWRQLSLTDRIVSLDSRTFCASLQLPYWGSIKTEYTLFALLQDMQNRGYNLTTSIFKWPNIFGSPSYAALGKKIRSLWMPTQEEQQIIESQDDTRLWSPCAMQSREDDFIQMRENLASLLAKVLYTIPKHEL